MASQLYKTISYSDGGGVRHYSGATNLDSDKTKIGKVLLSLLNVMEVNDG